MLPRNRSERFVGSLQNALRADVDPRAGRHLAVHDQSRALELTEVVPRCPSTNEIAVGDEDARRPLVRAKDADRLTALDEQSLVVREIAKRAHDRIEGVPASCGASRAAIHDEIIGTLSDVRVEIVHQHPQRRLLLPTLTGKRGAARRANDACPACGPAGRDRARSHDDFLMSRRALRARSPPTRARCQAQVRDRG